MGKSITSDLNPADLSFHLLKAKLKVKQPKNKQELKTHTGRPGRALGRNPSTWQCLRVPDFRKSMTAKDL